MGNGLCGNTTQNTENSLRIDTMRIQWATQAPEARDPFLFEGSLPISTGILPEVPAGVLCGWVN